MDCLKSSVALLTLSTLLKNSFPKTPFTISEHSSAERVISPKCLAISAFSKCFFQIRIPAATAAIPATIQVIGQASRLVLKAVWHIVANFCAVVSPVITPLSLLIKLDTFTAILKAFKSATTVPPATASSEKFLIVKLTTGLILSNADLQKFIAFGTLLSRKAANFSVALGSFAANQLKNCVT